MKEFLRKEDTNWACSDPKDVNLDCEIFDFPFILSDRGAFGLRIELNEAYSGSLITQ